MLSRSGFCSDAIYSRRIRRALSPIIRIQIQRPVIPIRVPGTTVRGIIPITAEDRTIACKPRTKPAAPLRGEGVCFRVRLRVCATAQTRPEPHKPHADPAPRHSNSSTGNHSTRHKPNNRRGQDDRPYRTPDRQHTYRWHRWPLHKSRTWKQRQHQRPIDNGHRSNLRGRYLKSCADCLCPYGRPW